MSYYDRAGTVVDGRPAFANAEDKANEEATRQAIEAAWGAELKRYGGHFDAIDWYAVKGGKIAAHVEMKARSHDASKYPTVFLNFRKWHALLMAWQYTGKPSLFVVRFQDSIRWIDVSRVDARRIRMGGCARIVKAKSDIEPVIEIPIAEMKVLGGPKQ